MEKKEKKLHKIHLKDYTNTLEKVLVNKNFSVETKNLLLSMFYKIENAYADYAKTKIEVYDKAEFLDKLIKIIDEKCKEIELIKFEATTVKDKYEVDKNLGKITTVGNELTILNAILELNQKTLCIPEEEALLEEPITNFLNVGMKMHEAEIIRDFNGWSWDNTIKEISNIPLNLIFQTYIYLLGYNFITAWIENKSKLADYLILMYEKLKESIDEKRAKKLTELFCKFVIELDVINNKTHKEKWEQLRLENNEQLELLSNKSMYLEQITKQKKDYTKQIQKIDKILNDKDSLNKEYELRNKNLPNKEKIFSIRHLIIRLEEERQDYVNKIKECNALIDPKGYVSRKSEISKKVDFLNILNLEAKNMTQTIINLCSLFLECIQIKIENAQIKQEIMPYFYIIRYYRFLPIDEKGTLLKDIPKLKVAFEKTIALLLEKASKLDVIDEVTLDKDVNYQIIHKLFDSKMIDLNNIILKTNVEDGKLYVTYYDVNIIENTYEISSEKTVTLKKKVKLFI